MKFVLSLINCFPFETVKMLVFVSFIKLKQLKQFHFCDTAKKKKKKKGVTE